MGVFLLPTLLFWHTMALLFAVSFGNIKDYQDPLNVGFFLAVFYILYSYHEDRCYN